jgi:hypothetical protein
MIRESAVALEEANEYIDHTLAATHRLTAVFTAEPVTRIAG